VIGNCIWTFFHFLYVFLQFSKRSLHYTLLLPVLVFPDHNPLVFLSRMYKNQRLMLWSLMGQGYNLVIKHKKGPENIIVDSLSRA